MNFHSNLTNIRVGKIIIFLITSSFLIYNGITIASVKALNDDLLIEAYEKVDLGISGRITEIETELKGNVILTKTWRHLLLNLTVQNNGDSVDTVILHATVNGMTSKAIFNHQEQVGFVKAISFDFELAQSLIMVLNHSGQMNVNINLDLFLERSVSLIDPYIDFQIIKAELIGLNPAVPNNIQSFLTFPPFRKYQVQPSIYTVLQKKLIAWTSLCIEIPDDMDLKCEISVKLEGMNLEYCELDSQKFFAGEKNKVKFNFTIPNIDNNNYYSLKIIIAPDYSLLNKLTEIKVEISVSGFLSFISFSPFDNEIGPHPIPSVLMLPILLISFFVIPYYVVYQEEMSHRDKNIIDEKNQRKI